MFLHCIEQHQGEGGDTMLTDGFYAADLLKAAEPDMYSLLSQTITSFIDVGTDYTQYDKITQLPFLM